MNMKKTHENPTNLLCGLGKYWLHYTISNITTITIPIIIVIHHHHHHYYYHHQHPTTITTFLTFNIITTSTIIKKYTTKKVSENMGLI